MTPAPAAICLQIVQKEHKKLPQIGCILKVQSGRRTDLPVKWIQLPFQRSPQTSPQPRPAGRQAAAPTSYCSPAHARQSPGGGQTTYSLPLRRGVPDTGQHRHFSFFTVLSLFFADGGPAWTAAAHRPDTGKNLVPKREKRPAFSLREGGRFLYGRKSDHIVVPGLGRTGQVGQGDFVQIIPDDLVQAAPHLIGAALGQAAAGRCTRFQTGDRGQIPLG